MNYNACHKYHVAPHRIEIICSHCGVAKQKTRWPMLHETVIDFGTTIWYDAQHGICDSCAIGERQ